MTLPSPPVDHTPAHVPRDIERALAAFGFRLEAPAEHVDDSVLNDNYRVLTNDGPRFLRFIRQDRTPERVLLEHRVTQHAASAGIPVPLPQVVGDHPFIRLGGDLVQLYPWVEGRNGAGTESDAFAMGEVHARLLAALAPFTDPELHRASSGDAWDTERSIQVLSRVDDLIRYYPSPGADQLRVQEGLRFQLSRLESPDARPASDFADLPIQACHGDYHNRNVIFGRESAIAAVVDWEVANVLPPVYEILRALSFSGYLDPPLLQAYLRGYAAHGRLTSTECELGVEMWWQARLHANWIYHKRFIQGDHRVDRFLDEEAALLRRFADPAYREWLADELATAAA
ncbi:MAG: phosphotransferase [Dehalococcoidia bacterium]